MNFLCLILGAILILAFAPFHAYWLAYLIPALFILTWINSSVKQAFIRGWLFGLGFFGVGVSWVYVSIHEYGGIPSIPASLITLLFISALACFPALQASILIYKKQHHLNFFSFLNKNLAISTKEDFSNYWPQIKFFCIEFPATGVLIEFGRAHLLTGFPWILLAYSQVDSPLRGFIPILGEYGTKFIIFMMAGILALLIYRLIKMIKYEIKELLALLSVFFVFILFFLLGYHLDNIHWTHPQGKPISVTLVQGNIPQEGRWQEENVVPIIQRYVNLTADHWQQNLIVWPEAAITAPSDQIPEFIAALNRQAQEMKSAVLFGIITPVPDSFKYYNSLLLVGSAHGQYHKRHLVMFGEYIPLEKELHKLLELFQLPFGNIEPGPTYQPLLYLHHIYVAPLICYEIVLERYVREDMPKANLIVLASNDGWFGHSLASYQHTQAAQFRALESGKPLVAATNTGVTAFIDDQGRIEKQAPEFQPTTLSGTIQPMAGTTPWLELPARLWLWVAMVLSLL